MANSLCPKGSPACTMKNATAIVTARGINARRVKRPIMRKKEQKTSAITASDRDNAGPMPNTSAKVSERSPKPVSLPQPWEAIIVAPKKMRKSSKPKSLAMEWEEYSLAIEKILRLLNNRKATTFARHLSLKNVKRPLWSRTRHRQNYLPGLCPEK